MMTECVNPRESHEKEKEFEDLVMKNIPGWTVFWKILLQDGKEMRKYQQIRENSMHLKKKIRNKITELVDDEETLVNLYKKAIAEAAKKEEESELIEKIANLRDQIEKDKDFMKKL